RSGDPSSQALRHSKKPMLAVTRTVFYAIRPIAWCGRESHFAATNPWLFRLARRLRCRRSTMRAVGARADSFLGSVVDGRYQVARLLGEGSMGAVYEVRHLHLNRSFALKRLS